MLDRSRCIIIVPVYQHVEPRCEERLRGLERSGYRVWRIGAGAAIDLGRNRLATWALEEGYHELMWIDSDIEFPVDAVDHLRELDLPLVGGAYPKKGQSAFAFHYSGPEVVLGVDGGLLEVDYLPGGFLHTRREVYEAILDRFKLPLCNRVFGDAIYPFFLPQIIPYRGEHWYLPEDFSFCQRARECGYKMMLDTSIRLSHIGAYGYSFEDSCGDRVRYDTFRAQLTVRPESVPPPVGAKEPKESGESGESRESRESVDSGEPKEGTS